MSIISSLLIQEETAGKVKLHAQHVFFSYWQFFGPDFLGGSFKYFLFPILTSIFFKQVAQPPTSLLLNLWNPPWGFRNSDCGSYTLPNNKKTPTNFFCLKVRAQMAQANEARRLCWEAAQGRSRGKARQNTGRFGSYACWWRKEILGWAFPITKMTSLSPSPSDLFCICMKWFEIIRLK